MLKKIFLLSVIFCFTSCFKEEFKLESEINLITREQGSGTRGAFKDIFKLEEKKEGFRKDLISKEAGVENNTNTIIQTIKNDKHSIGYISLGSINDEIKVLSIDGVFPSLENVKNREYKVIRSFNLVIREQNDLINDFLNFISSNQGSDIILKNSYIPILNETKYLKSEIKGKLTIGGSSSLAPIMEKLIEGYAKVNPNVNIELQISDSSTGVSKTIEKVYDIGLSSRNLTDKEKENLKELPIILDAIVIIVNKDNKIDNLTKEQIRNIYLDKINKWIEVK